MSYGMRSLRRGAAGSYSKNWRSRGDGVGMSAEPNLVSSAQLVKNSCPELEKSLEAPQRAYA